MNDVIGRVVEVRGINVKAKLFQLLPPYLSVNGKVVSAPKINSFVKTKVGLDTIICQVVGEYNVENNDSLSDYFLDLQVKGYLENSKFIQGLRMLPIVSANVSLLSEKDYSIIFEGENQNCFCIGQSLFETNEKIYMDYNKLIPSHVGIFGNTGSGKSNTLACILNNYISRLGKRRQAKSKVLIFDLNNEYGKNSICSEDNKIIYNLTTRHESRIKIPFKFDDLSEDDMALLLNATVKTQVPALKRAYKMIRDNHDGQYYLNFIRKILENNQKDLFFSLSFFLSDYIKYINEVKWHNKSNCFYINTIDGQTFYSNNDGFIEYVIDRLKLEIPTDCLDRLKFEICFSIAKENDNGVNSEFLLPLLSRADKLFGDFKKVFEFNGETELFHDKNVAVIQLANVNNDMSNIIPGLLANVLFKKQVDEKGDGEIKSIINVVIDEAHNILYKNDDDLRIHENVLASFEKLVKEGRKFGIYLMIASQRPSDISNTILSQLHNYFIHKLVNPNDIYQIRKTVAFMDESSMNFLTILAPGECVLSGTSVNMPVFIKVDELDDSIKPNSSNVVLFGENGLIKVGKKRSKTR